MHGGAFIGGTFDLKGSSYQLHPFAHSAQADVLRLFCGFRSQQLGGLKPLPKSII